MIDEIAIRLQARPFEPFEVLTSDGRRYRVPHPEHAHINPQGNRVVVWDDNGTSGLLSTLHIVSIKTMRARKPRRHGRGKRAA